MCWQKCTLSTFILVSLTTFWFIPPRETNSNQSVVMSQWTPRHLHKNKLFWRWRWTMKYPSLKKKKKKSRSWVFHCLLLHCVMFPSAMQCWRVLRWCPWWISRRLFASPDGSLINNSSCVWILSLLFILHAASKCEISQKMLPWKLLSPKSVTDRVALTLCFSNFTLF